MRKALLALLFCAAAHAQPAPDLTAYGLAFGQPLPLPECPRDAAGRYEEYINSACVQTYGPPYVGQGMALFPTGKGPKHARRT
jgi:hypothetical protein